MRGDFARPIVLRRAVPHFHRLTAAAHVHVTAHPAGRFGASLGDSQLHVAAGRPTRQHVSLPNRRPAVSVVAPVVGVTSPMTVTVVMMSFVVIVMAVMVVSALVLILVVVMTVVVVVVMVVAVSGIHGNLLFPVFRLFTVET